MLNPSIIEAASFSLTSFSPQQKNRTPVITTRTILTVVNIPDMLIYFAPYRPIPSFNNQLALSEEPLEFKYENITCFVPFSKPFENQEKNSIKSGFCGCLHDFGDLNIYCEATFSGDFRLYK